MSYTLTFILLILTVVLVAVGFFFWDRRYLKRPTRLALSASLKKEIEEEREENLKKRARFEQTLEEARKK